MSLFVLLLYVLPYFLSTHTVTALLIVPPVGAIIAAVTLIGSVVAYLWAPREKVNFWAFVVYLLLLITTATLIISTGDSHSAFIALWIAVGLFAGVFGFRGYVAILGGGIGYIIYTIITGESNDSIIVSAVATLAPLIASFIIWHVSRGGNQTKDDKAYSELASELSQVASKSDVVIQAIDDGVVALSGQGNIELMNPAAERLLGWRASDALSLDFRSVFTFLDNKDAPIDDAHNLIANALATSQEQQTDNVTLQTKSKKKRLVALSVSPIGQVGSGCIVVFRDVTRERAEEREQAEFISTASHEMRTPVASIEGYLGLALNPQTAQIDDKARDFITKAQSSAQHLGRLFQDLLDVSKAEDGRLNNNPTVIDLVAFVGEIVEGLGQKAAEKHLRLYYKPAPDGDSDTSRVVNPVYYTHVDSDHLREVTANLIENAIKYTPEGEVVVDVGGDDEHVTVSVKDSGIGIPREDIPHLFQKFYRVDNSATREIGGTGLGLYLCRRLVEVMGGTITVESEFQKGSTFMVTLPRLEHSRAMQMLEQAAEEPPMISHVTSGRIDEASADVAPEIASQPAPVVTPAPQPVPAASAQPLPPVTPAPTPPPPSSMPPAAAAPAQAPAPPAAATPTLADIEQNSAAYRQTSSLNVPGRGE